MAVAGHTHGISYVDNTKAFSLTFSPNSAILQPTDIYLNEKLNYPNGYIIILLFSFPYLHF